MRKSFICFVLVLLAIATCGQANADPSPATSEQLEFFEKRIRPIFAEHCYSCHSVSAEKLQASLLMDSRASLLTGGDSGEAIVPGDADASLLVEAVRYDSYEMPPRGKLPDEDIVAIERWVEMGAPWPEEAAPSSTASGAASGAGFKLQERKADHWVWQPIESPAVPEVADAAWPRDAMDHFVLAKLEQAKLSPAGDTDRAAWMRRLYFDLTGLPPTPEEAERFLTQAAPQQDEQLAEQLVDEVLESPRFGERWARHWLDLVRYAESRGHEFDNDTPNAYQYRDYVIRAFNADVPYDQFVREHIAGDLLHDPRLNPDTGFNESILGTGFWFLGEWVHSPVDIRKDESDRFDNMIDVMSKTFLGVTVSCARCHDHKFDAISTADYYSLTGFLQGCDYRQVRFESLEHNKIIAKQLAELDERYRRDIDERISRAKITISPLPSPRSEFVAESVVFDYAALSADQFMQDGFIFGDRPRRVGEAHLFSGDQPELRFATTAAAVSDPFWNDLESVSESPVQNRDKLIRLPRSGRTLRTPTFTLTDGDVACRVRGQGHVVACVDSHRLVAGPLHGETIRPIKNGDAWVELKLDRYVGHRLHLEFTPAENSQLEVSLVTQGATADVRAELIRHEQAIAQAVDQFSQQVNATLGESSTDLVQSWSRERSELQAQVMRRSQLAMAMLDGTGEDAHVLIRGNSSKPGTIEPRHFLTAVSGNQPMAIASGSGRLELAAEINDPANPLTLRVIVNRIWHHLIGRGIVPTTDDFGVLGMRPTHPELLDHLATRFANNGQSMKGLIRAIVLSRTYRMSSQPDPASVAVDPKNELWHHRPPQRLQGEAIRDALLSISGKLDETPFGEPVPIHLTAFMDGRGRPDQSGPLMGNGRRSIYIAVRRNFLSPFMTTFDSPTPFSTMGRRNVSNVPAQALILMNDPLVVGLAEQWGERAIETHPTTESRVRWMYQVAFARQPTEREETIAIEFVNRQANTRQVDVNDPTLWADLAHVLVNAKEFIFLR